MSYDIEIASAKKPDLEGLTPKLRSLKGVVSASFSGSQVELLLKTKTPEPLAIFIDEPEEAETESFDDEVLTYVRAPTWKTNITASVATKDIGVRVARAAAVLIANVSEGAAYDPQKDGVLWPRKKLPKTAQKAPRGEQIIDLIELQWVVPLPKGTVFHSTVNREHVEAGAELCQRFAKALESYLPTCLPKKVDGGRSKQTIATDLDARWRAVSGSSHSARIDLNADWPCMGGSVGSCVGDPTHKDRFSALDCIIFGLNVEAATFEKGGAAEQLRQAFVSISHDLDALFAVGSLLKGYVWARNQLWSRRETEQGPLLGGLGWLGIPDGNHPWIWLHRAYTRDNGPMQPASNSTSRGSAYFASVNIADGSRLDMTTLVATEAIDPSGDQIPRRSRAQFIPTYEELQKS